MMVREFKQGLKDTPTRPWRFQSTCRRAALLRQKGQLVDILTRYQTVLAATIKLSRDSSWHIIIFLSQRVWAGIQLTDLDLGRSRR